VKSTGWTLASLAAALSPDGVPLSSFRSNRSGVRTIMVCPVTTNLRRAAFRGNVSLDAGEGGLTDPSVVNVSQVRVVDRTLLSRPIGQLSERRVHEIIQGLNLLLTRRG
jgi:mRNA interferase MazF